MAADIPVPSPQAAALLRSAPIDRRRWEWPIEDQREDMRAQARAGGGEPEPVAVAQNIDAGGVSARLYLPDGAPRNVLVWLHGGSWMLGDLDCCDTMARALANRAGCAVLSVDYRLAPEHRCPSATDDAWRAAQWAIEQFERVAVGGDSAGGNLAAAVALRARDRAVRLALQVLVYPVLDSDVDAHYRRSFVERYQTFGGIDGFADQCLTGLRRIWGTYVPNEADRLTADVSPMRAGTLAGVADALLISAEHDMFTCESEQYARRLRDAGVEVEHLTYPGQVHSFYHLLGIMDDARDAIDRTAVALRRSFIHSPATG